MAEVAAAIPAVEAEDTLAVAVMWAEDIPLAAGILLAAANTFRPRIRQAHQLLTLVQLL